MIVSCSAVKSFVPSCFIQENAELAVREMLKEIADKTKVKYS